MTDLAKHGVPVELVRALVEAEDHLLCSMVATMRDGTTKVFTVTGADVLKARLEAARDGIDPDNDDTGEVNARMILHAASRARLRIDDVATFDLHCESPLDRRQ